MPNNLLTRAVKRVSAFRQRKRRIFTPQNRLSAQGQMISRGVVSLFNPQMTESELKTQAKKNAKRTILTEKNSIMGRLIMHRKSDAIYDPIFNVVSVLNEKRTSAHQTDILAHEYGHKHAQKESHLITANALGAYFDKTMVSENEKKLIQTKRGWSFDPVLDYFQKIANGIKPASIEHKRLESLFDYSISEFGGLLGEKTVLLDLKTKKPGLGLFVIRELSKGLPFSVAMQDALKGKFDNELIEWTKKNPLLVRMLKRRLTKILLSTPSQ